MQSLWQQRLLLIYCPGHAADRGNERADRLASKADMTSGIQLDRAEVLTGLRSVTALIARRKEEWRKEAAYIPSPEVETVCVQPDKHWHCFESNLEDTA